MSLFDKYLILKIFSFLRYRDAIKCRIINKFFQKELSITNIFWKEFLCHRDNPDDYILTYMCENGNSASIIFMGDEKDAEDMICQFLFDNLEILEYVDYSITGKKEKIIVYQSARRVWEEELNQINMHNHYISQNDGLTEEDYNPETGNPYYFDDLIPEPEFNESWLPFIAEPYSDLLEITN